MRLMLSAALLAALLNGCQTRPATHASQAPPKVIEALVDQRLVWSCPQCAMDYDGAGKCSMCDVDLVKTAVAYVCPADGQAVEHAGKCPRCEINAKVVKTAVADAAPGGAATPSEAAGPNRPASPAPEGGS